jgi:hypothetical protein
LHARDKDAFLQAESMGTIAFKVRRCAPGKAGFDAIDLGGIN